MEELVADVVVIGAGPAGQKAAIQAAKLGKKVIVIEKLVDPGGSCLFSGTIPSKTIREAIIDLTRFNERSFADVSVQVSEVTVPSLGHRLNKVIEEERTIIARQFKKNNIRMINGTARFENAKILLVVDNNDKLLYQIKSKAFMIATGSRPRNPTNVPFDDEVILDSTRLLKVTKVPKTAIVLGGGGLSAQNMRASSLRLAQKSR